MAFAGAAAPGLTVLRPNCLNKPAPRHEDRGDAGDNASQVRAAWPGAEALLRAASDGFEPASGQGFALPHVTLGVGAGRSRNPGQSVREAGVTRRYWVSAARAPESGAVLEIADGTRPRSPRLQSSFSPGRLHL